MMLGKIVITFTLDFSRLSLDKIENTFKDIVRTYQDLSANN